MTDQPPPLRVVKPGLDELLPTHDARAAFEAELQRRGAALLAATSAPTQTPLEAMNAVLAEQGLPPLAEPETPPGIYEGHPWHADESEDTVRFFRGYLQVFKAPKHGTPYAEYWPSPEMIRWMLSVLNRAEESGNSPPVGC